jgi:hypothetical protein
MNYLTEHKLFAVAKWIFTIKCCHNISVKLICFHIEHCYVRLYKRAENYYFLHWFWLHLRLGLNNIRPKNDHFMLYYLWTGKPTHLSRVPLGKVIVAQLFRKFLTFYETRMLITMFTRTHHSSLSWATWIQSTLFHLFFQAYFCVIFQLHLDLPRAFLPSNFPTKSICISHFSHACYMPHPFYYS